MTNIETYRAFCAAAPADFPVFMQDWYLDAVCESGYWDAAVVARGERVIAVFPYFIKQQFGYRYAVMPPLCRFMGPFIVPEYRGNRHEPGLLDDLIGQLPQLAAFSQDFNYTAQNWLPLYWRGFRQTTRYSYVLDVRNLAHVRENMAADYRNQKIPKAKKQVVVRTGDDLDAFIKVHNLSYQRQGLSAPVSPAFLQRLDAALKSRQARHIFFAEDRQTGAIHSVAYLIHDRHAAYYLMAGDDPALRHSGAGILTAWEAVLFTSETLQLPVFDFLGSMIQPIERVRRQFGATQQAYFRVEHAWALPWKIRRLRNFF